MCIKIKLYATQKVEIRKSKLALKLNKPAYIGMCILDLTKVLTSSMVVQDLRKIKVCLFFKINSNLLHI